MAFQSTSATALRAAATRYFLFPVANFHFRLQFMQSVDELFEFIATCGFGISFATCQPGNKSE